MSTTKPAPNRPHAVEGGFTVPLSDLLVDDELLEAARATVASGWWSMGPQVAAFERAFAEFCGSKHALAVSNEIGRAHV